MGTIGINTEDLLGLCSGGLLKARQSRRAAKGAECCLSFFLQRNDPKGLGPCIWLGPLRIGYTLGTQCFSMRGGADPGVLGVLNQHPSVKPLL